MTVRTADTQTWDDEVLAAGDTTVLVDFWAPWCGPCKALGPVLDQIADEHPDNLRVVKVNIDENPQLALRYKIISIPALRIFREGEVVGSIAGAKPKAALEAELAPHL